MGRNIFSEYFAKPKDSPEHRQLREALWLAGASHACRYYLSVILDRDFFAASDQEFLDSVRQYLSERASRAAERFCCCLSNLQFVEIFLKQQCELAEGVHSERCLTKQEKAMVLLVQHPEWSDARIRDTLRTTDKQMKRWSNFNAARMLLRRPMA